MKLFERKRGEGRTKVLMSLQHIGKDLVVCFYNDNGHVGAVAVGEYDTASQRTTTSVITRLGHKDDMVAQRATYALAKSTMKPVCVVAGIHVDDITNAEIDAILENCISLVDDAARVTAPYPPYSARGITSDQGKTVYI